MRYVVVCVLAAVLGACNHTSVKTPSPNGAIVEYGIYAVVKPGSLQQHPDTSTGKIVQQPVLRLLQRTRHIPVRKNTYFAYQYRLSQFPNVTRTRPWVDLKRVLVHPEIIRPDGSRSVRSERTLRKKVRSGAIIALDGYAFHEDYEMVPGDWIFQIWYQDRLLVEQRFTSYSPEEEKSSN